MARKEILGKILETPNPLQTFDFAKGTYDDDKNRFGFKCICTIIKELI